MSVEPVSAAPWARRFASARGSLPDAPAPRLRAARDRAWARFARHGFPTTRVEAWKYTNLSALAVAEFAAPVASPITPDIAAHILTGAHYRLVFVNGRHQAALSDVANLPAGVRIDSLAAMAVLSPEAVADLLGDDGDSSADSLAALNGALAPEGAVIRIDDGVTVDRPIQLLFLSHGDVPMAMQMRSAIVAGPGARVTVVESHVGLGDAGHWINAVTRLHAAEGAHLSHHILQAQNQASWHTARTVAEVAAGATYGNGLFATGAKTARQELHVSYTGDNARAVLRGAHLGQGDQHLDYSSTVAHARPDGQSDQVFKAAVRGKSQSVFQGRLAVAIDAQRTDAQQICRNLLLDDGAVAYAKPELEILADDVKCSHGATIGDLDATSLFYLRARGIGETEARAMLIDAFIADTFADVAEEGVQLAYRRLLDAWLETAP